MKEQKRKLILAMALVFMGVLLLLLASLRTLSIAGNAAFERDMNAVVDACFLELELQESRSALEGMIMQRAEERELQRREKVQGLFEQRLDERSQELLILVNPWNSVPENYEVRLRQVEDGYLVDARAASALTRMIDDCRAAGNLPVICSAYRTQSYQEELFQNKVLRVIATGVMPGEAEVIAARSVAVPGTSEHQLGLAVDIIDETYVNLDHWQENTSVQRWLMANCWRYGFILRYPNDKSDVTGIIYEPWHYRYVGLETAKAVTESGLCFEEYLAMLK